MMIAVWLAAGFAMIATGLHFASILAAIGRCRQTPPIKPPPNAPGVSLIRPVCGIENHVEETLRSAFRLDYPHYEIIICAAAANDPVLPLVQHLMASHPHVPARLLIGNESISDNPKLNNVCKGWRAAAHEWIVMADSNVLMPADYIQRMLAGWRAGTGLVASPPVGCWPDGFWAELECAFLNTYQVRWQYASECIGLGFAQGKSMLYRRDLIERAGGIPALASEPAEDAATTKLVRAEGLHIRLVDTPFPQPLGHRKGGDVWRRQLRWARLRNASFRTYYLPELFAGAVTPLLAVAFLVAALHLPLGTVVAFAALWYGAEASLAYVAGWQLSMRSPLAWMLRDALLPVLWIGGWIGTGVDWRGHHVRTAESGRAT
jgi:ceramide glucosyltransferase